MFNNVEMYEPKTIKLPSRFTLIGVITLHKRTEHIEK